MKTAEFKPSFYYTPSPATNREFFIQRVFYSGNFFIQGIFYSKFIIQGIFYSGSLLFREFIFLSSLGLQSAAGFLKLTQK